MSFDDVLSLSAPEEAKWLHGLRSSALMPDGYVVIGRKAPASDDGLHTKAYGWHQKSYRLSSIESILGQLIPSSGVHPGDTYISQATFAIPTRKACGFSRVQSAWVDLDYYDDTYSPERWAEIKLQRIQQHIQSLGLPDPSLIIDSGRGAYVKWMFSASTNDLPLWNTLQHALVVLFSQLKSDTNAKDASRVLRCLQTVNRKNSALVSVIAGSGKEYDFKSFAGLINEIYKREVSPHLISGAPTSARRHARAGKKIAEAFARSSQGNLNSLSEYLQSREPIMLEAMSQRSLNWARFCDLRDVAVMRGGFEVGQRNNMLLWMCNSLAQAHVITPANWEKEVTALLEAFPVGNDFDPIESGYLSSLNKRLVFETHMKSMGKVIPKGNGLYRPSNDYLINQLSISEKEQEGLTTIIGAKVKRARDIERKDKKAPGRAEKREARNAWHQQIEALLNDKIEVSNLEQAKIAGATGKVQAQSMPSPVELGICVSSLSRELVVDRTILSKFIKSKILTIFDAKDVSKSHGNDKPAKHSQKRAPVVACPRVDADQALKAIKETTAKQKNMIEQEVKREKAKAQSRLNSAVEKISKRATKSQSFNEASNEDRNESVPSAGNEIQANKDELSNQVTDQVDKDLTWAKEKVDMMTAAAPVETVTQSEIPAAPNPQAAPALGLRMLRPGMLAPKKAAPEAALRVPAKSLCVPTPPQVIPQAARDVGAPQHSTGAEVQAVAPSLAPRTVRPQPVASTSEHAVTATGIRDDVRVKETADTQFYVFTPTKPRSFPNPCTWGNSSLPLNTMMGKREWDAAAQDGRYFVLEVLGRDSNLNGLVRIINPDHPQSAELTPGRDVYGEIFAAPTDDRALNAIRALNGCTLMPSKGRARMPEGVEDKACIFYGHQFFVSRAPIEYTVTRSAPSMAKPVLLKPAKAESAPLTLRPLVRDQALESMPSMDDVLTMQPMDADDALDEMYAAEGLSPSP